MQTETGARATARSRGRPLDGSGPRWRDRGWLHPIQKRADGVRRRHLAPCPARKHRCEVGVGRRAQQPAHRTTTRGCATSANPPMARRVHLFGFGPICYSASVGSGADGPAVGVRQPEACVVSEPVEVMVVGEAPRHAEPPASDREGCRCPRIDLAGRCAISALADTRTGSGSVTGHRSATGGGTRPV